jgi:asparagine synthetase B (glutamine-hydrolysing)
MSSILGIFGLQPGDGVFTLRCEAADTAVSFLNRLNGIFAFALWDRASAAC